MIDITFSPALVMVLGAALLWVTSGTLRKTIALFLPLLTLVLIHTASSGYSTVFMGYAVEPFHLSALGKLFASTFALMAFGGMLYAMNQASRNEMTACALYAGSAIGVSLCGDFITLFVFWELMAIASTVIVLSGNTDAAYRAAMRYGIVHILSGTLLLLGIVATVASTGDASLRALSLDSPYVWAILAGFLINAGAPPLSAWIADAYPEASPSGTVFLCAFTTKAAVFALLSVFAGTEILIAVGLYMIFYGIIYALLENDMRRILAYSIVNQVGFMVVACGIGTTLAINAAAAHASVHIIYKGLLMMSAGSVLLMTGKRKCSDLGGLYSSMKVTALCGMVGAAAISAVPLTSGFVAKSLINASAQEAGMTWLWIALLVGAAGVFLHAGIKFPWFVFFNGKQDQPLAKTTIEAPPNMQLAMLLLVFICILIGLFPAAFYALLPYPVDYQPYTLLHVIEQSQLLILSAVAFFMMLPWLQRTVTISLDLDWFYRIPIPHLANNISALIAKQYHKCAQCADPLSLLSRHWSQLPRSAFASVPLSALLATTFAVSIALLLFIYYI